MAVPSRKGKRPVQILGGMASKNEHENIFTVDSGDGSCRMCCHVTKRVLTDAGAKAPYESSKLADDEIFGVGGGNRG